MSLAKKILGSDFLNFYNVIASPVGAKQSHEKRLGLPRSFQSLAMTIFHLGLPLRYAPRNDNGIIALALVPIFLTNAYIFDYGNKLLSFHHFSKTAGAAKIVLLEFVFFVLN